MRKIFCLFIIVSASIQLFAQENDTVKSKWDYSVSGDVVSRYLWRGTDFGNSPAIQPGLSVSYANFSVGAWGSASFANLSIQETDLFASFEFWKFKFTCWDYFYMNMDSTRNNYFNCFHNSSKLLVLGLMVLFGYFPVSN